MLLKLKNQKFHIYARSIFLQGNLLKNTKELNKKFIKFKIFHNLERWIKKNNYKRIDVALAYIQSHNKYINDIVIGIDKLSQLEEIVKSFKKRNKKFPKNLFSNYKRLTNITNWKNL